MRAVITTEVWYGEYDPSEFTAHCTVTESRPGYLLVTETVELGFMHQGEFITLASVQASENMSQKVELL